MFQGKLAALKVFSAGCAAVVFGLFIWAHFVSANAAEKELSEAQIKKEFIDNCLASSDDKYDLYKHCIGKFTDACVDNPDKYEHVLEDISVGPYARNCTERESIWWSEIFKKNAEELKQNIRSYLKDKKIEHGLKTTLTVLSKRSPQECHYETVRWGFRDGSDLVNIAGLDMGFRCSRDINAEAAITIYLWNNQLKAVENIK